MQKNHDFHPSVRVNGEQLKSDRKNAGFTQVAFSSTCGSVSLVTVRRAEQGKRVMRSALERMAAVLKQPTDRFVAKEILSNDKGYVISIEGEWTGFFVEADVGKHPYIVEEVVRIEQNGKLISGNLSIEHLEEEREEQFESTFVIKDILLGFLHTINWEAPIGSGTLILKATRSNNWLEGFSSWYDIDTAKIETSRVILLRKNCSEYLKYYEDAKSEMARETQMYHLRKLVDAGYEVEEAVIMLSALNRTSQAEKDT